jgi:hypothetical protein
LIHAGIENMNQHKEAWMHHAGMVRPNNRYESPRHDSDHNEKENLITEYVIPTILVGIPYVNVVYAAYSLWEAFFD